jgi:excisionase family DNA binding protein
MPEYLKEFYTLEQLSKELNINIQTLRKFIKEGKLTASKVGTRYIVSRDAIRQLLKETEISKD